MDTVIVSAGVIFEGARVLISQRKSGSHLGGMWEFPGGKVESGEDPREALRRELEEELGLETDIGEIIDVVFHEYAEANRVVLLLFFEATMRQGSPPPQALDVAAFRWARSADLAEERFPPADAGVLRKVLRRLRAIERISDGGVISNGDG